MESLDWVDRTYIAKHKSDDPTTLRAMYYPNLSQYSTHGAAAVSTGQKEKKKTTEAVTAFLIRFGRRAGISLSVYLLSFVPYVGRFVLPAASFYTFRNAVGTQPAIVIFATGLVMPKKYLVRFLQSYFSSRSLMRELVGTPILGIVNMLLMNASLNLTSLESITPRNKRENGSKSVKEFCSASE